MKVGPRGSLGPWGPLFTPTAMGMVSTGEAMAGMFPQWSAVVDAKTATTTN